MRDAIAMRKWGTMYSATIQDVNEVRRDLEYEIRRLKEDIDNLARLLDEERQTRREVVQELRDYINNMSR